MGHLEQRAALAGRVAAVIGGAAGIGEAVTLALARAGVDVALCDRKAQAAPIAVENVRNLGRRSLGVAGDACDVAVLGRFYDEVAAQFGHLDIVVNVAGGTTQRRFMDMSAADVASDIRRNYAYVLDSIRLAVPLLRKSGRGGSIINFTTIEAHRGAAGFAVYAGAKAALTNFTRALAVELGAEKIRVNTLAPDTTPSEGNQLAIPEPMRSRMAAVPVPAMMQALGMYIPLKSAADAGRSRRRRSVPGVGPVAVRHGNDAARRRWDDGRRRVSRVAFRRRPPAGRRADVGTQVVRRR